MCLCWVLIQKEKENCDAPFLSLARAFHSLYQESCSTVQNLSPAYPTSPPLDVPS